MLSDSSTRIPHYNGLYGELNTAHSAEYVFSELIATRSKTFGWVIRPHIHTRLFQVFCVESGTLIFQGGTEEVLFAGPGVILVPPSVLHGLTYHPDIEGRILTFSDRLVEDVRLDGVEMAHVFSGPIVITQVEDIASFTRLWDLICQLDEELFSDRPAKKQMLQTYLTQLLIMIHRMRPSGPSAAVPVSPALSHFRRFQQLIRTTQYPRSIESFADELHMTAVHLNRICKTVAGQPALQIVQTYLMEEAQKYLIYTSQSVSEIAYLLRFEYPNYFAKLFRKHTGMSPSSFRVAARRQGEMVHPEELP
ncbi:MAG: helix-turn-helix domain-containing protein [Bacteroidia bacterium]|nr:helix-turn-helix domain-containing protein [Bacteroidia bacterium]